MTWYENDRYDISDPLAERVWPQSLALVRVRDAPDKRIVEAGWGKKELLTSLRQNRFKPEPVLNRFLDKKLPFAIVMRSVPYVCVDIDGKNGGQFTARIMGLTPTLAETSKSGKGWHLFYRVPDEEWDPAFGFKTIPDFNGIGPGVDIRGTGLVYHYPSQRWNNREIARMPLSLERLFAAKKREREVAAERRAKMMRDDFDRAILEDEALQRLAKHIPTGKRNTTLFAIACNLHELDTVGWQGMIRERGQQIGLEEEEVESLIRSAAQQ